MSTLKSRGTSSYSDTLTVPSLSGTDSVYGFTNAIFWSDKSKSAFNAGNGSLVLMRDTLPIVNNLVVSGRYAPDDTALVYLAFANQIDTSRVASVLVWYSLTGATTPDFTDTVFTTRLSAKSVATAGASDTFAIVNALFNNEQRTITAAVVLVGRNGHQSDIKTTSFSVGKQRPSNPIVLKATALSSNTIRLTWSSIAGSGVQRVVIWYRSGSAVPLQYDFSTYKLDSLVPSVADTAMVSAVFSPQTKYFFGAQVYENGLWSYVTANASASDSTWATGAPLSGNSTAVTSLTFDTSTDQIRVCWNADSVVLAKGDSMPQLAIVYGLDSFPATPGASPQVIDISGRTGCAYVKLRENLAFDHTYFVSLWLRASNSAWTPPGTPAGRDTVHVPAYRWQAVQLFGKDYDTVYAFNSQLRFTNTPGDASRVPNVVVADSVTPYGFIPASIAFEFRTKDAGVPFNVGLKILAVPARIHFRRHPNIQAHLLRYVDRGQSKSAPGYRCRVCVRAHQSSRPALHGGL